MDKSLQHLHYPGLHQQQQGASKMPNNNNLDCWEPDGRFDT